MPLQCCRAPDINFIDGLGFCRSCGELQETADEAEDVAESDTHTEHGSSSRKPLRTSAYAYSPLEDGEFRLLELQPGAFDEALHCEIFHGRIGHETYEAISYTWADNDGNQDLSCEIIVSSGHTLGILIVRATMNCEMALRRVRNEHRCCNIWIDALCINQNDSFERGHQVRQMPDIYANASRVIAYLGEAANGSDLLLGLIASSQVGRPFHENPQLQQHLEVDCLQHFLRRRWFGRVWCLQEIGMAKQVDVICGGKRLGWERLVLANLSQYKVPSTSRRGHLNDGRPYFHGEYPLILRLPMNGKQPLKKFFSLLEFARRSCQASDPRDMVYALLGLLEHAVATELQADYEISTGQAFNMVTEYLMTRYRNLSLLHHAEYRALDDDSLASWAIDWTAKPYDPPIYRDPEFVPIHMDPNFAAVWNCQETLFRFASMRDSGHGDGSALGHRVLHAVGSRIGSVLATATVCLADATDHRSPSLRFDAISISRPTRSLDNATKGSLTQLKLALAKAQRALPFEELVDPDDPFDDAAMSWDWDDPNAWTLLIDLLMRNAQVHGRRPDATVVLVKDTY